MRSSRASAARLGRGGRLWRALALAATLAAAGRAQALEPEELYRRVERSVWNVTTYDGDGLALKAGSGVVIGREALLTNCHVLAKARRVGVSRGKTRHDARLQHIDVERDLCQLAVPGLDGAAVALGDSDKLAVGQRVYAIGNPQGMEQTLSDGLVSALRTDEGGRLQLIQITAPVSPGSSGGGLFDAEGRLVGITTLGSRRDAQNLNFAVPVNGLRELPSRSAEALAARRAAQAPTPQRPPWAALEDRQRVPVRSEEGRAAYASFLASDRRPRAFAVSAGGGWAQALGAVFGDSFNDDPAARAMRDCERVAQERCVLYADGDEVVYHGEFTLRPAAPAAPAR